MDDDLMKRLSALAARTDTPNHVNQAAYDALVELGRLTRERDEALAEVAARREIDISEDQGDMASDTPFEKMPWAEKCAFLRAALTTAETERDEALAQVATLREALSASRDVHSGIADHILDARGDNANLSRKGMFADLQRARIDTDKALTDTAAGFKAGIEAACDLVAHDYVCEAIRAIPVPAAPDLTLTPDEVRMMREALEKIARAESLTAPYISRDNQEVRELKARMDIARAALAILDGMKP